MRKRLQGPDLDVPDYQLINSLVLYRIDSKLFNNFSAPRTVQHFQRKHVFTRFRVVAQHDACFFSSSPGRICDEAAMRKAEAKYSMRRGQVIICKVGEVFFQVRFIAREPGETKAES